MQTAVFRGLQGKVSHGLFVSLVLVTSWKAAAHDRQEMAGCRYRRATGSEQLSSQRGVRLKDRVVVDARAGIGIGLLGSRRPWELQSARSCRTRTTASRRSIAQVLTVGTGQRIAASASRHVSCCSVGA